MLANIDIFKKALPTIRFMGGREFDFLCKKMKINKNYNKLSFFTNLMSIIYITINSIKKYGLK